MKNYLTLILDDYFKEITKLEGLLFLIEIFIKYTKRNLETEPDRSVAELSSTYRDLSQKNSGPNLFRTGHYFSYMISYLKQNASIIVSRECCFGIAQTYEVFESFLKNILIELLMNRTEYFYPINKDKIMLPKSRFEVIEYVNLIQRKDRNNKKLLWFLRRISDFYKKHEMENIWNYNMANCFDMMSEIRHAIIHNRQNMTIKVREVINLNKNQEIFNKYFNKELSDTTGIITTDRLKTGEIIHLFNQFAHLIWKSLSLESGLDADYQACTIK